jgi:hypothetical protein
MVKVQDEGDDYGCGNYGDVGGQQIDRSDESEAHRVIDDGLIRTGTTVLSMYIESTTSRWYWTRESGSEKLLFRMERIACSAFIKVFRDGMLVHWPQT